MASGNSPRSLWLQSQDSEAPLCGYMTQFTDLLSFRVTVKRVPTTVGSTQSPLMWDDKCYNRGSGNAISRQRNYYILLGGVA